jgi:PleD family two-component response regulator
VKQRPLILLAEDSKVQARMISMVLNRYNFDVEVATNGEMALELFRANPKYDLILMVHAHLLLNQINSSFVGRDDARYEHVEFHHL